MLYNYITMDSAKIIKKRLFPKICFLFFTYRNLQGRCSVLSPTRKETS